MTAAHAAGTPARGLVDTLTSEILKTTAMRSTTLGLLVIALLSVGVGTVMSTVAEAGAIADTQAGNEYSIIFYSSGLVTWAFAYLAASTVAMELQGIGAATFTATARRTRVLAAKLLLVAAGAALLGTVASVLTVAATQGVLAARGIGVLDVTDPGLVRAIVLFVPCSMLVQGLLAACFAVLVRSAAGAVAITGLISLGPVSLAPALGEGFATTVPRWLPGAAVESVAGVAAPGSHGYLPWPWALACVTVWGAVACLVAVTHLRRTDIRS